MYCSFCGEKNSFRAVYCRNCGKSLSNPLEDTQPLQPLDETAIRRYSAVETDMAVKRSRMTSFKRLAYRFTSIFLLFGLIYATATFKTMEEYRTLTIIYGGTTILYFWWKAK